MPKFLIIISLFVFSSSEILAQKIMEKSWDAGKVEALNISSDEIFKIEIGPSENHEIKLEVRVEGEHQEHVVLDTKLLEKSITLTTGRTPFFEPINDKLAAHKVMAIELYLWIPRHVTINVKSKNASVLGVDFQGIMEIELENGNCVLYNVQNTTSVSTQDGAISMKCLNDAIGEASSENGSVVNSLSETGKFLVKAKSVNGDITLENYPY